LYGVKYKTVRGEWSTLHESLKQETYWYQLTASWVKYLTNVHNHTALKSLTELQWMWKEAVMAYFEGKKSKKNLS